MSGRKQHNWVTFYNPRNGKVRVSACANCGIAKDFVTTTLPCVSESIKENRMKKMGWEELPKTA